MLFPLAMLDLFSEIIAITLSLSTTTNFSVLAKPALLVRTCCGIYGVPSTLGSYLTAFLRTGCGNFTFLPWLYLYPTQCLTRYVHGQRVVCSTSNTIQVLDFSRSIHPSSSAHEMFLRSNPSCVPKESIFVDDVITQLPYYTVNRTINQKFFAFMIDDERIIGLRASFIYDLNEFCFFLTLILSRSILYKSLKIGSYTYLCCSRLSLPMFFLSSSISLYSFNPVTVSTAAVRRDVSYSKNTCRGPCAIISDIVSVIVVSVFPCLLISGWVVV